MNQGYSLRAAAKIVGIAHTTFDNYKKRGIVTPDVADKNGEFSLFSEAQIELAKAYRAANPPKTKKQNPGNTSDNLFDEHAPNETIAAALVDRNSPADDDATNGDDKSEIELVVGNNDREEKNTPALVNDEDAPFEESDNFSFFAEQNDTSGDSSGDNRLINTGEEYGGGDDDNTPPENSEATISQPANDEDAFKLDDPAEFNRASDDEHENQNVVGAPAPVACKLTVDEARALGLTYEEFMANQKGVTVEEYLESQRKRQEELQRAHEELFGSDSEGESENLPAVASEVTVESPPFFDNSVVLLEEKTLQELADEGRVFFSRGDDCLKQGALYYVEGGRRLVEAKRRLKHGQWQEWLKANFSFSHDTAANFMKLAERFGGANYETFRNFKPAVLIKMLALPVGDEDAFIEAQAAAGKPVEDLTAREVQKAVKEWKNAAYQQIKRAEKEAKQEERRAENKKKIETLATPLDAQGLFQTIVIDPPWDWGDEGDVNQFGRAKPEYSTMPFADIKALPINKIADANCHLYLWVTNRSLPKAFALIDAWGFRYITCLTWCKPSIGMGNYFRGSTEQVLFAVKGSQPLKRHDVGTYFNAPRGDKHSAKPDEFYQLVESCSYAPFIDIFGRKERDGWSVWGENGGDDASNDEDNQS